MDEPKRLYRPRTGRMLSGVCAGLANYFGMDPTIPTIIMIKIGIIGGAGYTAGELIRLLINHPEAEIAFMNSSACSSTIRRRKSSSSTAAAMRATV